ncbi:unnamed protein product [Prorocentrum cordatum]|uniref:J domain-containing protein n=1 Tax=Prorocentrum cordatum TaxID=2364126 RepID=A0ABN9QUG2_9DINO|nr:unnamed protein product [Polarella glacialis]
MLRAPGNALQPAAGRGGPAGGSGGPAATAALSAARRWAPGFRSAAANHRLLAAAGWAAASLAGDGWGRRGRRRRRGRPCSCLPARPGQATPTDFYGLLGLPRFSARAADVHRAYRRVLKLVHPDVLGGHTTALASLITTAYHTLRDEAQRHSYDDSLRKLTISGSAEAETEEEGLVSRRSSWESSCAPEGSRGVFVDESECVMCVRCVECAPSTFEMDWEGSGRARVTHQYADPTEDVDWAVASCPVEAISYRPRDELELLEDIMAHCDLDGADGAMQRRQLDFEGSRQGEGPFDYLQQLKSGKRLPEPMRGRLGSDRREGDSSWLPGGTAQRSAAAPRELGAAIAQAAAAVPEEVRRLAWPPREAQAVQ